MSTISPDARLKRIERILESEVDGDVIALDIERGHCYGLNGTASEIWKMLAAETTLAEICSTLVGRFDVERADCEQQVATLLSQLRDEGLLDVRPAA